MNSVWMIDRPATPPHPPLAGTLEVDTVVIGGGITGVTTALLLSDAGQSVALLEAATVGASNTGGSTGNIYGTVSAGLSALRKHWDEDDVRDVVAMRLQAVDLIERTVERFAIDCAFARRPLYLGVAGNDCEQFEGLDDEFEAAEAAGLAPQRIDAVPGLPAAMGRAVRIDRQAQFNPFKYTQSLAAVLRERRVFVHEHSAVLDIDASEGLVTTAAGEVRAKDIVLATHTPKGFNLVQAEMEVFREYGIAAPLRDQAGPAAICWMRDWVGDGSRSIRSYRHGGRDYLVVVGEIHKTGHHDAGIDYHQRLRDYAREHFGVADAEYAWSAQQYRSADALPYVGASAHHNVFIATGFGADGLAWGTVAADIISELIQSRDSRSSALLAPKRFNPVKSAKGWAAESATTVGRMIGDRLKRAEVERLGAVRPGEGRIVELGRTKYAVCRSPANELSVLSPVCPHLKCHVAWNAMAASWDCPCHGSRFDTDGAVIEGPALQPLERFEVGDDQAEPFG